MPTGEQQIFNLLIDFFEEDEWDFQWMEGESVLMLGFTGQNGTWMCYAQAREQQQQLVFYSVLPVQTPAERRPVMAELLTRINYGMVIGNFEMDYADGEIRYKTSLDIEGSDLTHPMIRQVVYANVVITDRYFPAVMKVIYSDTSPQDILEEIDGEDGDDDEAAQMDDFFATAQRALREVIDDLIEQGEIEITLEDADDDADGDFDEENEEGDGFDDDDPRFQGPYSLN